VPCTVVCCRVCCKVCRSISRTSLQVGCPVPVVLQGALQSVSQRVLQSVLQYLTNLLHKQAISKKVSGAINKVDEWADNVEGVLMGTPGGILLFFFGVYLCVALYPSVLQSVVVFFSA